MSREEFKEFMRWLWNVDKRKYALISFGHLEEMDENILAKWKESRAWCQKK